METVLVVGASGIIGVSAVVAALRCGRRVLAIVRNAESAEKLFLHVGTRSGITIVEADVLSDKGVQSVVERVKAGKLPAFQHVFATVGVYDRTSPIQTLDMATFREVMKVNLEANFLAYRATVPYLIAQGSVKASWTLVTGGSGDLGRPGVSAVSQGALFSLANVACLENEETNIRFVESYLCYRVDYDAVCDVVGTSDRIRASDYARVYERILTDTDIDACRVSVNGPSDILEPKIKKKLAGIVDPNPMYRRKAADLSADVVEVDGGLRS